MPTKNYIEIPKIDEDMSLLVAESIGWVNRADDPPLWGNPGSSGGNFINIKTGAHWVQ